MSQQVSIEAALPVFRQRCSELHDENLMLRARMAELEAQNEALRQELTAQHAPQDVPAPGSSADQQPYPGAEPPAQS